VCNTKFHHQPGFDKSLYEADEELMVMFDTDASTLLPKAAEELMS
jgi:hypothetical protein